MDYDIYCDESRQDLLTSPVSIESFTFFGILARDAFVYLIAVFDTM